MFQAGAKYLQQNCHIQIKNFTTTPTMAGTF